MREMFPFVGLKPDMCANGFGAVSMSLDSLSKEMCGITFDIFLGGAVTITLDRFQGLV